MKKCLYLIIPHPWNYILTSLRSTSLFTPKFFYMKKLFFIGMIIPLLSVAQKPTVIAVTRFFPKNDKYIEFEKAVKNHAQKYHTGDYKWRTYTVETGPDAGSYQMVEGPATWEQVDKRGTLGAEHNNDLYKNVLPNVEKTTQMFISYREDLSSVPLTEFSDKIAVTRVFPKPGKMMQTENNISTIKKMWQGSKQNVAVYEASSSGPNQYIIVHRYKEGLKERDPGFMKPMLERFDAANGAGAFEKWQGSVSENTEKVWYELLYYNADLSSK
jgi:hypothetical protein